MRPKGNGNLKGNGETKSEAKTHLFNRARRLTNIGRAAVPLKAAVLARARRRGEGRGDRERKGVCLPVPDACGRREIRRMSCLIPNMSITLQDLKSREGRVPRSRTSSGKLY